MPLNMKTQMRQSLHSLTLPSVPKYLTTDTEMKRLKLMEEENSKLKKLVADLSLDKAMLQDVIERKL